ncbi:unnamed protein product [Parascedosporium putredinis]|uniref:Uncharacterized protein n=1 Tax=Parascedosporium putredinis TaxID=1442378 RepID=A0A9P1GX90_9PEZI|nr:unnamed protein product [Parascedosporium putredinis]CAI7990325.1 unnamed protein product [Parascedosporium putredinis]
MLSAMLLEAFAVPLRVAPAISMMAANGVGLVSFLMNCFAGGSSRGTLVRVIVVGLTLSYCLLQFTSTILLSDVSRGFVTARIDEPQTPAALFGTVGPLGAGINGRYLYRKPIFPAFAELKEGIDGGVEESLTDRTADTGTTLRAYLPINDTQTRRDVQDYTGPATLFDNRVFCTRPLIQDPSFYAETHQSALALTGELRFSSVLGDDLPTIPRFSRASGGLDTIPILCSMPVRAPREEWSNAEQLPLSICLLQFDPLLGGVASIMHEAGGAAEEDNSVATTVAFLVVSTEGYDGWYNTFEPWASSPPQFTSEEDAGVWTRINTEWRNSSALVTLCYSSMAHVTTDIHAYRSGPATSEPTSKRNGTRLDTTDIQTYFGSGDTAEPSKRSLFDIERKNSWIAWKSNGSSIIEEELRDNSIGASVQEYLTLTTVNGSDPKIAKSIMMGDLVQVSLNDEAILGAQSAVFSDTLKKTRNPAKAVQSFLAMQQSLSYYDYLDHFNIYRPSTSRINSPVTRPVGRTFFFVAVATIAFHLVVVVLITVFFLARVRWITIGSPWQCLVHLNGQEMQRVVTDMGLVRNDDEAVDKLRKVGLEKEFVGLTESDEGIRILRMRKSTTVSQP